MLLTCKGPWIVAIIMVVLYILAGPVLLPVGVAIFIGRYSTTMRSAMETSL